MNLRVTKGLLYAVIWLMAPGQMKAQAGPHWVGSWAASQQVPETANLLDPELMRDATLRQIVHLSVGGSQLRVRLSNAFGKQPLHLTSVHVARSATNAADGSAIDAASDRAVTFHGAPDVTIPAGAEYLSDAVALPVAALSSLAISIHFDQPPVGETGHPGSRETSYVAHGDLVSAVSLPDVKRVEHWYQVSGVDVVGPEKASAVVTLGDSITDGHGATTNGNDRWPDVLAGRMQADKSTRTMGVLNEGIGGNRLLLDGLGPNALARFDRDVVAQTAVRAVIVLEGVNDLGTLTRDHDVSAEEHAALVGRIEAAFHKLGNKVIIAGRRQHALDDTVAVNPGMASAVLNIEDAAGIRAFAQKLTASFPALNVVIHNAGIMRPENLLTQPDVADAEATITTNLIGPIRLTAALLPHLQKQPHATIMTVSSGLAFTPMAITPTYCATKAAIHSWSQSLRYQLKSTNIEVVELVPPYVQTELMGSQQAADPRAMPLKDFLNEVVEIIKTQPNATEILVERVKPLRFAASNGEEKYNAFFKQFNDAMLAPH